MNDEDRAWYPTEGGETIGEMGPEGGTIVADAEWGDPEDTEDADARLTIERDGAAHVLTAQVYGGWLYLTKSFGSLADAERAADALRPDLERLSAMIPMEDERDVPRKVEALLKAAAEVEARG